MLGLELAKVVFSGVFLCLAHLRNRILVYSMPTKQGFLSWRITS